MLRDGANGEATLWWRVCWLISAYSSSWRWWNLKQRSGGSVFIKLAASPWATTVAFDIRIYKHRQTFKANHGWLLGTALLFASLTANISRRPFVTHAHYKVAVVLRFTVVVCWIWIFVLPYWLFYVPRLRFGYVSIQTIGVHRIYSSDLRVYCVRCSFGIRDCTVRFIPLHVLRFIADSGIDLV